MTWRCPAGVQKERMIPEDMYVMSSDGTILEEPVTKPPPHKPPKCSECGPLFLKVCPLQKLTLEVLPIQLVTLPEARSI